MSAGPGHVQRTILGTLVHTPYVSTLDLVNRVYGLRVPNQPPIEPTEAQFKSVWRALRSLQAQGIIEKSDRMNRKGYHLWVTKLKPAPQALAQAKLRTQQLRLVG